MRVCVAGAGVAGLAAAYRLSERGHRCDVYERWPGLGGQAATLDVGAPEPIERYYHHLFTSDRHIAELYRELGMPEELEWRESSVAFFLEGRSWSFTSPTDLLRFRPLSVPTRLRMGLAVLWLQRNGKPVSHYEDQTARHWIRKRMGEEAYEKVWGPLLRGKFGNRAGEISMAWLWSKLTLRRSIKGEEASRELLGYPRHSFERLFEALERRISDRGGRVLIDRPVKLVERTAAGFEVTAGASASYRRGHDPGEFEAAGAPAPYDAVVSTVPNGVLLRMLSDRLREELGSDYRAKLEGTDYHTALCLILELDRQFSPYYWTNIADPDLAFVGLIEHSNLIEPERYHGRRFLYVANYLEPEDPLLGLEADELIDYYLPGLRKVRADFDRSWIRSSHLFREPAAQPIVTVGYHERIPPLRTAIDGLIVANTTQIYPEDRGTNYSVRLGTDAAKALVEDASATGTSRRV